MSLETTKILLMAKILTRIREARMPLINRQLTIVSLCDEIEALILNDGVIMNFNEYQELAGRTEKPLPTEIERLVHAALGLSTEVGEFTTPIKAAAIYGKPMDLTNIQEELGDILWYVALAANAIGWSLNSIARQNIEKLKVRFPDAYSDAAAQARADKPAGE